MSKKNSTEREKLEPIQYDDIYRQDDVPLTNIRESTSRYLIYAGAFIMLLFIILGFTIKISRIVKSRFEIKNMNREMIVRFFDNIYLLQSFVKPGDYVEKDHPLIRFNSARISDLLTRYKDACKELERFETYQVPLYQAKLKSLELNQKQNTQTIAKSREIFANNDSLYEAKNQKAKLKIRENQTKLERNKELFKNNIISKDLLETAENEYKSSVLDSVAEDKTHKKENLELLQEIQDLGMKNLIIAQQIIEKKQEMLDKEKELKQKKEEIQEEILQGYGDVKIEDNSLVLPAKHPGIVSFLIEHDGTIYQETTILRLEPKNAKYRVVSSISPFDVSRVNKESPLKLQFDTYPSYIWGYLEGKIARISTTTDAYRQYPFEAEIISEKNSKIKLQPSLTGTCLIKVYEGVFFQYVFREAKRILKETFQ